MKKTLLEIVQSVLNSLDSDEVNSINDTIESQQVALMVKDCYEELIANRNWPHLKKLIQFNSSGTVDLPNYLKIPEGMKELIEFWYNCVKYGSTKVEYKKIKYLTPEEFLQLVDTRNSELDYMVKVIDDSGITFIVQNNKAPEYYTSFDDEWIVLDSYDSSIDDTIKKEKTKAICYILPSWTHEDSAYPDLPDEAFPLLIAEVKSTASIELRQMANQKQEQKSSRQNRWLSRKSWRVNGDIKFPNYGRKSNK